MADRWKELKYPSAIKKRVEGDWNCVYCNNLNFAFRANCNRCSMPKVTRSSGFNYALYLTPKQADQEVLEELTNSGSKSIELPSLSPFYNEAFMNVPTKAKPLSSRLLFIEKENEGVREGDWVCSNCSNLNYGFRQECNRCETDKSQVFS
mmetsp:Transcript_18800/g.34090  ORF Transcript_18800/g.34090 Transcript_18800/m.34090 type:complete len:150 (+) Transcript_18800:67-516(+)